MNLRNKIHGIHLLKHNYSGMTSNMFHIDSVANISPERNRSQLRNEKTTRLSLKIESYDSYDMNPMNDERNVFNVFHIN